MASDTVYPERSAQRGVEGPRVRPDPFDSGSLRDPPLKVNGRRALPGFGLSLGITGFSLGLVVLLPLSGLFFKTFTLTGGQLWEAVADPRALASYRLSFGAALAAAVLNTGFGMLVAWVLVRYRFPGRALVDALVDLPFALPTAVAGLTLTALYAKTGILGGALDHLGIAVAFTPLGVVVALTFVGLPFVVRTVQPVLAELDPSPRRSRRRSRSHALANVSSRHPSARGSVAAHGSDARLRARGR